MTSYTPVNWALTGAAGALTVGRYAIRGFNSRRFYWDDAVHLFALLVLIVHGVTNQLSLDSKAAITTATKQKPKPSQATLLGLYEHNQNLSTVNNCFLYLVFWIVKFSFLMFYRLLFQTSAPFRKAWWVVAAFSFLTFWVPIGGVLSTCAGASTVADYQACTSGTYSRVVKLEYSCSVNVVSDLMIMALPLWMIKDLKITLPQKIGLIFIFCLAFVCIALDILRVVEAVAHKQALYTIIEINFVVIISCLPTYRALLGINKRRKSTAASGSKSRTLSGSHAWRSIDRGVASESEDKQPIRSKEASDIEMGGKGIHVTRDFKFVDGERDRDPYSLDALDAPNRAAGARSPRSPLRVQARAFS